jgi:uncharacterized protein YqeY
MIDNFTFEALKQRGWQPWDKPDKEGFTLMLCPLNDFVNVPDGTVFDCIMGGRQYVKGLDEIDKDTRMGVMAFGVKVNDESMKEFQDADRRVWTQDTIQEKEIQPDRIVQWQDEIGREMVAEIDKEILADLRKVFNQKQNDIVSAIKKVNAAVGEAKAKEQGKTYVTPEMARQWMRPVDELEADEEFMRDLKNL